MSLVLFFHFSVASVVFTSSGLFMLHSLASRFSLDTAVFAVLSACPFFCISRAYCRIVPKLGRFGGNLGRWSETSVGFPEPA